MRATDLSELAAFDAVARHRNFRRAGEERQDGPNGARDVEAPQPRRGRRERNRDDERDRHEHDDRHQLLEQQAGGEQPEREDDGPIRDPGVELGAEGGP